MEIDLKLDVTLSLSNKFSLNQTMAVPLYTPRGIGPPNVNNNRNRNVNRQIANNNRNQNQQLQQRQRQRPAPVPVGNNDVLNNPAQPPAFPFPIQLFHELYLLYLRLQDEREQRAAAASNNRRPSRQQEQINHSSAGAAGPSTPPGSPRLPLPDIIQCHAQIQFNFSPHEYFFEFMNDDEEVSVKLELDLRLDYYRRAGRQLRRIADNLDANGLSRRNDRRNRYRLSFTLDLSVAATAIALLGGFAYYIYHR